MLTTCSSATPIELLGPRRLCCGWRAVLFVPHGVVGLYP